MKHPYQPLCACKRCQTELARRFIQSVRAKAQAQREAPPRRSSKERWARNYYDTEGRSDPDDR